MSVGLVCPRCDALTDLGASQCPACGASLGWDATAQSNARVQPRISVSRMEDAMSMKPCPNCGSPVPVDDRFCGKCGGRTGADPAPATSGKTMFFSGVQLPGRAKLILVKGDSGDG